ncbi:hypothetical protein NKR23_g2135 [Pleurostoma richardsiae]|uniref:Uncharacterized protein n=1 Tax=Pleurostoma richardsiae TaxID=41990 RepID=A0AA38RYP7_9PEZI|nr:hypothetical protein NKR23_g2135 [Pleurostoma richardsiae]
MATPLARSFSGILERFDDFHSDLVGWLKFFENPINEVDQRRLDDLKHDMDELRDWLHGEEARPRGVPGGLDDQPRHPGDTPVTGSSEDRTSGTRSKKQDQYKDVDDSINLVLDLTTQMTTRLPQLGIVTGDSRYIGVHLLKLRDFAKREQNRRLEEPMM